MVLEIESTAQYTEVVEQAGALPIFIDFFATWCGPCVMIKPIFEQISQEYEGKAVFIKIDVDKNEKLSAQFGISAMPTFYVVKGGAPAGSMKGANPEGLKKFVADNAK